jgi:uncharacterized protein YkwD
MPPTNTPQNHIPRRLRAAVAAAAAACSLTFGAIPAHAVPTFNCAGASKVPGTASPQALARVTHCLINGERVAHGLHPLRMNRHLSRAAHRHSSDMVRRHYYSHTTPSGVTFVDRIRQAGYLRAARSWTVGENLDWGTQDLSSPAMAVNAWMHSPPHRANLLGPSFREIGIGVVFGSPVNHGGPAATYTTDFGVKGLKAVTRYMRATASGG